MEILTHYLDVVPMENREADKCIQQDHFILPGYSSKYLQRHPISLALCKPT